jgi:methylmalonyl-CoA/ethylmalonyl-CoA epimerase
MGIGHQESQLFQDLGLVLDHIAIACEHLEQGVQLYEALGFQFSSEREVVSSQQVTTAFASCDQQAHLELLEPLDGKGPIADHIQKRGQGLHHLCFRVKDIAQTTNRLTQLGYRFLYPQAVPGARDCLVNFLHPKSAYGVLIELSERSEGNKN